eukprot:3805565-Rhodomonas_salina.1
MDVAKSLSKRRVTFASRTTLRLHRSNVAPPRAPTASSLPTLTSPLRGQPAPNRDPPPTFSHLDRTTGYLAPLPPLLYLSHVSSLLSEVLALPCIPLTEAIYHVRTHASLSEEQRPQTRDTEWESWPFGHVLVPGVRAEARAVTEV